MSMAPDLVRASLEMLVLRRLADGAAHGAAIAMELNQVLGGVANVSTRSVYHRLRRLEGHGAISSTYDHLDDGRLARVYRIKPAGWKRLEQTAATWAAFTGRVGGLMRGDGVSTEE